MSIGRLSRSSSGTAVRLFPHNAAVTVNRLRLVGLIAVILIVVSGLAQLSGTPALGIPLGLAGGLLAIWVGLRMRALS